MDFTRIIRKYEADKLILLGLFIAGLLIARQLSWVRYDRPRKAGQDVISEIKAEGIINQLDSVGRENFFIVKNTSDKLIGFAIDVYTDTMTSDGVKIEMAGHFHLRKRGIGEHLMAFESNNALEEFIWKTQLFGPGMQGSTEVRLDKNNILRIGRIDSDDQNRSFKLTSPAIPKLMEDFVIQRMLQGKHRRIIIDMIDFDGEIQPISFTRVQNSLVPSGYKSAYEIKLELPNDNRVLKLVSLDNQGRVAQIIMEREGLILERSSAEVVLQYFPDRAGYILQKKENHSEINL
jgi:hypothetical protein